MANISSLGVGSNIDANSIVTQLMAAEKQPLTLLQQQATKIQTQISEFGKLQSLVSNFRDAAADLTDADTWKAAAATSSDATSVSATASTNAVAGNYAVQVDQLAQNQTLASAGVLDPGASFGGGSLQITLGTYTSGTNSFTTKSGTSPINVTIAPNSSLSSIRDAINGANAGVSASLVKDGANTRLVLRSTATGEENGVRITATDADGNNTDAGGLSALAFDPTAGAGAGKNLSQTQAAKDAKFNIDGLQLTSSTNKVDSAIQGVSLNLTKVTTSPTQISVAQDNAAIKSTLDKFVKAYNAINSLISTDTAYDASTKKGGPLQGDRTITGLQSQLRNVLRQSLGSNGLAQLSNAGIQIQKDGSLSLNSAALDNALADISTLRDLFTRTDTVNTNNNGFAVRFRVLADQLLGTNGSVTTASASLAKRLSSNQQQQSSMQNRLDNTEARLRAQYTALDTQISSMTQTANALTQQLAKLG